MKLSPSAAKKLGIEGTNSVQTKADKDHGKSACRGLQIAVSAILKSDGVEIHPGFIDYKFDEHTRREMDVAWPAFKVCVELQGFRSHSKRGQMERDYAKLAAAQMQGWKVFYATERQCRTCAVLWVVETIKAMLGAAS